MPTSRQEGNLHVAGTLSANAIAYPSGSTQKADEQEHRYMLTYSQESATGAADGAYVVHVVHGATGVLNSFKCGVVVACVGAATIDVDLLVNGVSVLSSAVEISVSHAAYELVSGTISGAALEVNDVVEVSIDETTGGGTQGKGVFAVLELDEDAA